MRIYLFASIALLTASPLFVVACGGSSTTGGTAKSPEPGAPAPGASGTPEPVASTTTTTTALLSDAGDLQGTKLETKTTTTTETKPDGGAGPHKSEAGRSVADIQTIIMARRDEFRACYDRSLKDHPGIEGDLDVKWVIDPKGNVTDTSIDEMKSGIAEPGVRKCVVDIIKKIKFAESAKGFETRAHYPFNFNPKSGGKVQPAGPGK